MLLWWIYTQHGWGNFKVLSLSSTLHKQPKREGVKSDKNGSELRPDRVGRPSGQNEAPKNVVSECFRSHDVLRHKEEEPIWHHKKPRKATYRCDAKLRSCRRYRIIEKALCAFQVTKSDMICNTPPSSNSLSLTYFSKRLHPCVKFWSVRDKTKIDISEWLMDRRVKKVSAILW